jgi:hypothetical protein
LFRFKDSSLQKVTAERFKLPQSDSVLVERLPNNKTDSLIYLMASLATTSKTTFLYLVEIPANLNFEKLSITFIGSVAPLVRAPIVIDMKRVLLLSEVEMSEIVEISEAKRKDPQRPFIQQLHRFDNFGIIQQIEIDREKKQLLLNSYKQSFNLQSFQKGLLLESVGQFKVDLSHLRRTQLVQSGGQLPLIVFYFPSRTLFFHLSQSCQLYQEKKLDIKECLVHFQAIDQEQFYLVGSNTIKVMRLWSHPETITEQSFTDEETILAADSFCSELFVATEKKLKFYSFSQKILTQVHEINLQTEPKIVRCMFRKVFVVYWTEDYVDSFGLGGNNHSKIKLGVRGIHSLCFFYTKNEDRIFLLGLHDGSVVQKVIGKDDLEKSTQILVVGKKPVTLREISPSRYVAISDESAMLSLAANSNATELVPLCHPEMTDLHPLMFQGNNLFFITSKNNVSFNITKNGISDNCRLKEVKLGDSKAVDRFFSVGNTVVTCHSDLELCAAEIVVHDLQSGSILHKTMIPVGQIEAMAELKFQENTYFLVGLSTPGQGGEVNDFINAENLTGKFKVYLLRKGELIEIYETFTEKPIRGIHLIENGTHVLVNVGYSTLKVL